MVLQAKPPDGLRAFTSIAGRKVEQLGNLMLQPGATSPGVDAMRLGESIHSLLGATLVLLAACVAREGARSQGASGNAGAAAGGGAHDGGHSGEVLACLAFISTRCAGECHHDASSTYGMDLSTGNSIYESWLNRNGVDNCEKQLVPRVVPGQPDASFVYRKITSQLSCVGDVSQAMPPPPAPALSAAEIEIVRAWIAAGAPMHCDVATLPLNDGAPSSGGSAGAANLDEGGSSGSGGGTGGTAAATGGGNTDDLFKCTTATPCSNQLICHSVDGCSAEVWECITHRPPPPGAAESSLPPGYQLHHPCPAEIMEYCGCDGVTFTAPVTCADRPYERPGNCSDGYNCDARDSVCGQDAPTCPSGEAPKVAEGCYAGCVVGTDCRCEFNWECPTGWQCDRTQWRCTLATAAGGT